MALTIGECSQHASQCKEDASKADNKDVRKFLLHMEKNLGEARRRERTGSAGGCEARHIEPVPKPSFHAKEL